MSNRTNDSDQIEFIMEKQVGETDSGQVNKLQAKRDDKSDDRVSEFEQRQRGGGTDRLPREWRKSGLQSQLERTTPGFVMVKSKKSRTARDAETTLKKKKVQWSNFER